MAWFRKKPILIEATQWFKNGDHPDDCCETLIDEMGASFKSEGKVVQYYRSPTTSGQSKCRQCGELMHNHGWIDTPEGGHIVCPRDWIATGVKGERYPIKPGIMEATFDWIKHV